MKVYVCVQRAGNGKFNPRYVRIIKKIKIKKGKKGVIC